MRKILLVLIAAGAPLATASASPKNHAGTSAGEFLKLGGDARGIAMGGEMSAVSEDAAAAFWNPAGLAQLDYRHATLTGGVLQQNVRTGYAAYAHPVKPLIPARRREMRPSMRGTLALAVLYLNAGGLEEVDNTGKPTGGSFTPRDSAFIAAWGASFTEKIDLGIGLKYVDSRIQSIARTGSLDLGGRFNGEVLQWPYVLALNARNIGGSLHFREESNPLPTSYRLGQSIRPLEGWTLTADIVLPRDNGVYPAFGTEVRLPIERMDAAVRLGWNGRTNGTDLDGLSSLSLGFGLGFENYGVDMAWLPAGVLGTTLRFALNVRF